MEKKSKNRKLNYLDEAILFMKSLLKSGKRETARSIKGVLLEVCRDGTEYDDLKPHGEVENMYRLHIPPFDPDDDFNQGFRVIMIIMEKHVLATSIGPDFS